MALLREGRLAAQGGDSPSEPRGELTVHLIAMPADTNANGDIFGGWVLSQMDQAGASPASSARKAASSRSQSRR
jgi:acyl-CoA thioesterase YciA